MSVIRRQIATGVAAFVLTSVVALGVATALAAGPDVAGETASGVTGTSATLEAQINPESQETTYFFEYSSVEANLGTASATKLPGSAPLTSGPETVSVATGAVLKPGVTYYFRAVAENAAHEKTEGTIEHFTTSIETPVTRPATGVTGTSAELNGRLNPKASGTAGYFFFYSIGTSCTGGGETTHEGPVTGKGVPVNALAESLEGNTEYAFCVVSTSPTETLMGAPKLFVTARIAPKVDSETALPSGLSTAFLLAKVDPENERTSCVFEYGTTSVTQNIVPCSPAEPQGSGEVTVTASLSGLTATAYKYRVVLANKTGKTEGAEQTFSSRPSIGFLLGLPTAFGAEVAAISVSPGYLETSCVLVYGTEASLAHGTKTVPCEPASFSKEESFVQVILTSLMPETTYYYRVILENATTKQEVNPFEDPAAGEPAGTFTTTAPEKPVIESESSSSLSPTETKLVAKVNPEEQETKCEGFEYSESKEKVEKGEGTKVACDPEKVGAGRSGVEVSATIAGLTQKHLYYYRLIEVKNGAGKAVGAIEEFTVLPPALPLPVLIREYDENVTPFGVEVVGEINSPNANEPTSCFVEYTATESESQAEKILEQEKKGTQISCEPAIVNGQMEAGATPLLKPNTEYFLHVIAENKATEEQGTRVEETSCCGKQLLRVRTGMAQPPAVEEEKALEVTALHAKLEAKVNPDNQKTTVEFEYSSDGSALADGKATKISLPAIEGGAQTVSVNIGEGLRPGEKELTPGETYYYRVIANNETSEAEGGPVEGQTESFMTLSAPVLSTAAAQNVSESSATLSGTIDPEGAETTYHYDYIAQTLYNEALASGGGFPRKVDPAFNPYATGSSTPEVTIAAGNYTAAAAQPFTLTELAPGTEYVYALVATSTQEENGQKVATTVIEPGVAFKVEGVPIPEPKPEELKVEYPTGPLAGPTPITPIPQVVVPNIKFPEPVLTNKEKLEKALTACKEKHMDKSKQTACETQARKRYTAKPKKKSTKKKKKKKK
jgi:hypothetical protein